MAYHFNAKLFEHTSVFDNQFRPGPGCQSIVSLTSSLRGQLVKCFRTLKTTTLIFFVEKMREAFAVRSFCTAKASHLHCKSFSHFFNKKYWHISDINV